jgi:FixJ family two-component response regulator
VPIQPSEHGASEMRDEARVLVVDDDETLRKALGSLFRAVGLKVALYASAGELLDAPLPDGPRCLVLDVQLRGRSGLELQTRLAQMGISIPIVFITGHGDVPMSVSAMKAGAHDFITKPFSDEDLLHAVRAALEKDRLRHALRESYRSLTPREKEVMGLAARGLLNKQIAAEMGISEVTVKIHRGQAMRKMKARSFAELVLMAEKLGVFSVDAVERCAEAC